MSRYENKIKDIYNIKKEIDSYKPFEKKFLNSLKEYYRIGLTYTSNALEGNSLTETETKIVLEEGITIGGKLVKDHLEAIGHSDAYSQIYKLIKHEYISEKDIRTLHKLFYFRINPKHAGSYRKAQVFITGTDFIPPAPIKIPEYMAEFISNIAQLKQQTDPITYAALLHLDFVSIHPFVDGNGRCARLLMNIALLQAGYPITVIPPVVRSDYINTLKIAQTEQKNKEPFINFISTMVYEAQRDQLRLLQNLE